MEQAENENNPNSPTMVHGVSSESYLENILSEPSLSGLKRLRIASWIELRLLLRLAAPAIMVYLINNSMSISTRIFSGHLGNLEFAAVSLGNQGIQLFAYGLLVRARSPWIHYFTVQSYGTKVPTCTISVKKLISVK